MKAIKRMLLGIAVSLMGISISCGFDSSDFVFIGWAISLFGLIIAVIGYYFTDD